MKILNEFGIKPTTNHTAAGFDFYIPNITLAPEDSEVIFNAWSKSYKKSIEELHQLFNDLILEITAALGEEKVNGNEMNILQLFLMLDSPTLNDCDDKFSVFVDNYLVFDKDNKPGLTVYCNEQIFVNSGIHVALDPNTAGIFFNKSGKGVIGWDVRACVVDEDYTGFVHLSLAFGKDTWEGTTVFVGDKITQMVVLPIIHSEVEEIDKDMYERLMSGSQRGSAGFGSSDEKH